ncbi:hypothetical protein FBU30_006410 [Linnemannia zychae]|nr:hypothetical protein FBU30_006410 [Linnemannia zychae]
MVDANEDIPMETDIPITVPRKRKKKHLHRPVVKTTPRYISDSDPEPSTTANTDEDKLGPTTSQNESFGVLATALDSKDGYTGSAVVIPKSGILKAKQTNKTISRSSASLPNPLIKQSATFLPQVERGSQYQRLVLEDDEDGSGNESYLETEESMAISPEVEFIDETVIDELDGIGEELFGKSAWALKKGSKVTANMNKKLIEEEEVQTIRRSKVKGSITPTQTSFLTTQPEHLTFPDRASRHHSYSQIQQQKNSIDSGMPEITSRHLDVNMPSRISSVQEEQEAGQLGSIAPITSQLVSVGHEGPQPVNDGATYQQLFEFHEKRSDRSFDYVHVYDWMSPTAPVRIANNAVQQQINDLSNPRSLVHSGNQTPEVEQSRGQTNHIEVQVLRSKPHILPSSQRWDRCSWCGDKIYDSCPETVKEQFIGDPVQIQGIGLLPVLYGFDHEQDPLCRSCSYICGDLLKAKRKFQLVYALSARAQPLSFDFMNQENEDFEIPNEHIKIQELQESIFRHTADGVIRWDKIANDPQANPNFRFSAHGLLHRWIKHQSASEAWNIPTPRIDDWEDLTSELQTFEELKQQIRKNALKDCPENEHLLKQIYFDDELYHQYKTEWLEPRKLYRAVAPMKSKTSAQTSSSQPEDLEDDDVEITAEFANFDRMLNKTIEERQGLVRSATGLGFVPSNPTESYFKRLPQWAQKRAGKIHRQAIQDERLNHIYKRRLFYDAVGYHCKRTKDCMGYIFSRYDGRVGDDLYDYCKMHDGFRQSLEDCYEIVRSMRATKEDDHYQKESFLRDVIEKDKTKQASNHEVNSTPLPSAHDTKPMPSGLVPTHLVPNEYQVHVYQATLKIEERLTDVRLVRTERYKRQGDCLAGGGPIQIPKVIDRETLHGFYREADRAERYAALLGSELADMIDRTMIVFKGEEENSGSGQSGIEVWEEIDLDTLRALGVAKKHDIRYSNRLKRHVWRSHVLKEKEMERRLMLLNAKGIFPPEDVQVRDQRIYRIKRRGSQRSQDER